MLVLTRKIDQGIVIAGNIYVRVLGVERDRVKIGISAPVEIPVLRLELLDRDANDKANSKNAQGGSKPARKATNSVRPQVTAGEDSQSEGS